MQQRRTQLREFSNGVDISDHTSNTLKRRLPCCRVTCLTFASVMIFVILGASIESTGLPSIQYHENQTTLEGQPMASPWTIIPDSAKWPSKPNDPEIEYHMVFSTGCDQYQDWQSYVFFYHAMKVGQPGHVTRIASGCTPEEAETLKKLHKERIEIMSDRFHLHITPEFMRIKQGLQYKYFNKPYGMRHWMESTLGFPNSNEHDDSIIFLLDPDQILLRPITHDFSNATMIWHPTTSQLPPKIKVEHGSPFAQLYGYESQWKSQVNVSYVLSGEPSPVDEISWPDARDHYPAGPPYVATARDMYRIVDKWTEFAPKVHDEYPHLLAEMFAYSLAAAHLQLPHQLAKSFMISNVISTGEGWPLIDNIAPESICTPLPRDTLPFVLHYCQPYMLGKWFIDKRRLPKNLISCESPLLMEPPDDIAIKYNYSTAPGSAEQILSDSRKSKRSAFALCTLIPGLNEAADFFKRHGCDENVNFEKIFNFNPSSLDEK